MHGIKRALKQRHETFNNLIISIEFKVSKNDKWIYYKY